MKGSQLVEIAKVVNQGISRNVASFIGSVIKFGDKQITASNGFVVVQVPFDCGFEGGLKGGCFVDAIGMLPTGVEYDVTGGSKLQISSPDKKIKLEFHKDDAPIFDVSFTGQNLQQLSDSIFSGIKNVINFVGVREVIPVLRGVAIRDDKIYASDNIRIAKVSLGSKTGLDVVIAQEAAERLIILAEGRKLQEMMVGTNLMRFKFEGGVIVDTLLLGVQYPDFNPVFEQVEGVVIMIPNGLGDAVRRVLACQEGVIKYVVLEFNGGQLRVMNDKGVASCEEVFDIEDKGLEKRVVLLGEELLALVDNSKEIIISSGNDIVYFRGKNSLVMYAMMPIEE